MTEMGREQLLVKPFFGHAVVALEVVSRGYAVPNTAGCRVLCQTLAERRKFRCHVGKGQERSAEPKKAGMEEGPGGHNATKQEVGYTNCTALRNRKCPGLDGGSKLELVMSPDNGFK